MPSKEVTAYRRNNRLCLVCGKPAADDRASCEACLKKCRDNAHKYKHKNKERRDRLKAQGLCEKCGKEKDDPALFSCADCRIKYSAKTQRYLSDPSKKALKTAANKLLYRKDARKVITRTSARAQALRTIVLNAYGGPWCACCGETMPECLQIDHINGSGNVHRRSLGLKCGGGNAFYQWLINNQFPPGYQILCASCNFAKGKKAVCPHQLWRHNPDQLNLFGDNEHKL